MTPWITLLKDFRLRLPRRGRPPDIQHESAVGLGFGLELQLRVGGYGGCDEQPGQPERGRHEAERIEHEHFPATISYGIIMRTTERGNKAAQHADASWVACAGVNAAHIIGSG